MAKTFPVTLYHKDTDAFVRSQHSEYPIVVQTQEDFDALEPGWCEDPVEAAEFGKPKPEEIVDELDEMIADEEKETDSAPKKKVRRSRRP